jgi:hypothetical protein
LRRLDFTTIAALIGRRGKALLTPADLGAFPHPLVEKGFLVEAGRAGCVSCPCGGGHFETVTRDLVCGKTKYSVYCPESGGLYDISADDLRLWTISIPAIMKEIQRRFQCSGEPVERACGLWYLGESQCAVAGFRRQIFFTERLTAEVDTALPEGSTQILIIGEENPASTAKFKDRVFQMHELFRLDDDGISFDMDRIAERCGNMVQEKKPLVVPKNAKQKSREEIIKDFLKERMMTLRDAYWNAMNRERSFKLPRRPSLREIAETICRKTGNKKIPESTVKRTIEGSTDKELRLLWENMTNENFIRDYHRKQKRAVIRDGGDEEYLSEMFSQTAPEPPGSGFHTV